VYQSSRQRDVAPVARAAAPPILLVRVATGDCGWLGERAHDAEAFLGGVGRPADQGDRIQLAEDRGTDGGEAESEEHQDEAISECANSDVYM